MNYCSKSLISRMKAHIPGYNWLEFSMGRDLGSYWWTKLSVRQTGFGFGF